MSEKVWQFSKMKQKPSIKKLIRQLRFARIIDFLWICDQRTLRVVQQLGRYKEEAKPALPKLYKIASIKSDYRLRGKAIIAIGKIGCSESIDFLIDILKGRTDQRDRLAAIEALQYFGEEITEYIAYFKDIALKKEENSRVRHQALKIIAVLLEKPNEFLMSFISPVTDDVLELTAVKYLGIRRVEEALPILLENIKNIERNYGIIEYLFAIARIERNIYGYGIRTLELAEEKGVLNPLFQQPQFRSLYHSIRTEQIEKFIPTSEEYIDQLIEEWENQKVEFKSSLYYCPYKKKRLKKLFYNFVQSVSAFANTNEGRIIIGVDNNKKVIGVKGDFEYWDLDDNPKDKYLNEFTNQLIKYLKNDDIEFVKFSFEKYKDDELFIVSIVRPDKYIYVNGNEFYRRINDSDRRLTNEKLASYIKSDTEKRIREET